MVPLPPLAIAWCVSPGATVAYKGGEFFYVSICWKPCLVRLSGRDLYLESRALQCLGGMNCNNDGF